MKLLIEDNQLLKRYLNPSNTQWSEIHYNAISCLEGVLMSCNSIFIVEELIYIIKDIALDIVSSSLYLNDNKYYYTKVSITCEINIKLYKIYYHHLEIKFSGIIFMLTYSANNNS